MAAPKKPKVPSPEEKQILYSLLYDSCLFQAHGIIQRNVRDSVSQLLRALHRPDLVVLWEDEDTLSRCIGAPTV